MKSHPGGSPLKELSTPQIILSLAVIMALLTTGLLFRPIFRTNSAKVGPAAKEWIPDPLRGQGVILRAETTDKIVALTFDDGPDPRFTPAVLAILKDRHIRATFFVVGEDAALYPELVRNTCQAGHEIENHSYTHPDLMKPTDLTVNEEIAWCQETIESITGAAPIYFRPPRRLYNSDILKLSGVFGYRLVLWSVCLENRAANTPEKMAARAAGLIGPGAIILAHDGHLDRSMTVKALPILIDELQRRGYRFVTLRELLSSVPAKTGRSKSAHSPH